MNANRMIEAPKSTLVKINIQDGNGCPSDFPGGILEKIVVKSTGRRGGGTVLVRRYLWLEYSLIGVFDASIGDGRPAWQLGKVHLDQSDKLGGAGHHGGHLVCVEWLTM